jgi:hypothetical protein
MFLQHALTAKFSATERCTASALHRIREMPDAV